MAAQGRIKTKYPGVYYTMGKSTMGKPIKRYYVVFKRDGKVFEEAAKVLIDDGPETRPAETPQEASAWRSRRIGEVTLPQVDQKPLLTINQIWEKRCNAVGTIQASTQSYYTNYILPEFGQRIPGTITSVEVEEFGQELRKKGKAPATIWQIMTLLTRLVRWAVTKDLIAPVNLKPTLPKFDNQRTETMTEDQIGRYWQALEAWPEQHDADFFRVMLLTGVRKSALAAIEWDDIDFETGFLTLQAIKAKSGKARKVPLPEVALQIFKSMHRHESHYVWPGRYGGHRKNFGMVGNKIRKAAGLPEDFRPCHGLRHTFASTLASSGKVTLYTLQTLLTHSNSKMTERYAHLADEALSNAASVANEMLAPKNGK
ncbi:MAG: site-specific integrase [Proteobacteria bacterium]|nr:site-specific integrase [Pseudomonadota bacterium]